MVRPKPYIRIVKHARPSSSILMKRRAEDAERRSTQAEQRLEAFLQTSLKLAKACDENEVAQLVLPLAAELAGAEGAAFVPLDEHDQPQAAASYGKMPVDDLRAWLEYLATPRVREGCRVCEARNSLSLTFGFNSSCRLLNTPFGELDNQIYCLPVRQDNHEYGLLSLYLPNEKRLDRQAGVFLKALIDQTSLAMEGLRIREREMEAIRHLQVWRHQADLDALWSEMLDDLIQALEVGFAVLVLQDGSERRWIVRGDFPSERRGNLDRALESVFTTGEARLYVSPAGGTPNKPDLISILAAPIIADEQFPAGVLLVGNLSQPTPSPRLLAFLQVIAGQVGTMIQNAQSTAVLEYETILKERMRLSREIHDGLAQTLAFLKLQTTQMQQLLAQGDHIRLEQGLHLAYTTLSEAYEDARQAIDGLRIEPNGKGLSSWLVQVLTEFEETSGIDVKLEPFQGDRELAPEVHAQLIRIVQEALSNVRKHTRASQVRVSVREDEAGLVMEIGDNGTGFSGEEAGRMARHGIQGMRERAELIGADLQLFSGSNQGTVVRLRLPRKSMQLKG